MGIKTRKFSKKEEIFKENKAFSPNWGKETNFVIIGELWNLVETEGKIQKMWSSENVS